MYSYVGFVGFPIELYIIRILHYFLYDRIGKTLQPYITLHSLLLILDSAKRDTGIINPVNHGQLMVMLDLRHFCTVCTADKKVRRAF